VVAGPRGLWLHGRMMRVAFLAVGGVAVGVFGLGACAPGAPRHQVKIAPPAPTTVATLAGPLCDGQACQCRDPGAPADGGAGVPDEGVKRFEIRVGPSEHALWVTLDDMVLYKGTARAEECFYVDLGAGDHVAGLRASHPGGISAAVRISEYGAATSSWYDTYRFSCGSPGVCSHGEIEDYKGSLAKFKRGIQDPCGSVKVKGITWDTGEAPDQEHPDDLVVGWTLDVYDFPPRYPHGDGACANRFE
jgi:hypothetical protein